MPQPRLVIAGTGGDSGKTLVSLGLCLAWRDEGVPVVAFKKGPDYIDAAWLAWASDGPVRNLDTYLMGGEAVSRAFAEHATHEGINLVEGNRGLYDGVGAEGTHSTAELAKLLEAPVLLVLDVTKRTRTAAALALGCIRFDPRVRFAGVVLNRVGSSRHRRVATEAIEATCGVPVLGAISRLRGDDPLPGRHLGLVTVQEHGQLQEVQQRLIDTVRTSLDLDRIAELARSTSIVPALSQAAASAPPSPGEQVVVGVLRDSAFTFYYPENLEALEGLGARLEFISAIEDASLPDIDALYIGGGFPETHAEALTANRSLLDEVRRAGDAGMPIYAECGGMMYLARTIRWRDRPVPMAGVLPIDMVVEPRPQGHGYAEVEVDTGNPFFVEGTRLRGHEFHYSRVGNSHGVETVFAMKRGTGSVAGRDGIVVRNVLASYLHVHARGTPEWARGIVECARTWKGRSDPIGPEAVGGGSEKSELETVGNSIYNVASNGSITRGRR